MPSSSADAIAQFLNEQFQADDVFFQIVEHSQVLHVYLNHQPGAQIDYTRTTAGIQQAVVSNVSSPTDGFWLYSRELGNTEPNWQTYIQTPRHTFVQASSDRKSMLEERDLGNMFGDLPTDMVQLTGTTDEMQRAIGFAAISQDEANAATEIAGGRTTVPNLVKASQVIAHSYPEEEEVATEMSSLGSSGMTKEVFERSSSGTVDEELDEHSETEMAPLGIEGGQPGQMPSLQGDADEDAATEMVSLGRHGIGQSGLSVLQTSESLDEHSSTEVVPLAYGESVRPSFSSPSSGEGCEEESATEMVSIGYAGAGMPSTATHQLGGTVDEESATEMVSIAHEGAGMSPTATHQLGGTVDEESATEMVSIAHEGAGMPSTATHQLGGTVDEESATEMMSLSGIPSVGVSGEVSQYAAEVDEESATEMASLGGAAGSVLSSFAAGASRGMVDEDSATEVVPLGASQTVGKSVRSASAKQSAGGPIAAEDIKLALNRQFQADGLRFQVAMRDGKWHICANRAAGTPFDFDSVGDGVRRELQTLADPPIRTFWFYSRSAGQQNTERKALIQLTEERVSQSTAATAGSEGTAAPPSEPTSNVSIDLSAYCFVRNRLLLQGKLLPPSDRVTRLLETYHQLSDAEKMGAIDSVDRIFKGQKPKTTSDWLQELEQLSDSDLRQAAIWFSRYCEQPADTIQQIDIVLNAPKASPHEPKPAIQLDSRAIPVSEGVSSQSPPPLEAYRPVDSADAGSDRRKANHLKWLWLALPLVGVAWLALAVFTGSSKDPVESVEPISISLPECQFPASTPACDLVAQTVTPH